ncbi:hypothetical protein FXO38_32369 [Capsicum annuum]|nr:hypothetical protein FXO38_32369 [Capsicum annuum]KAF3683631.1 hypothetical protein FXO37_01737 [Capsicum annuum]
MSNKVEKVHERTDAILEHIINEHRGNLEVPLTHDNIKAVLMDIFAAGSSISATTVEWAVVELLKNQVVLKIAQPETREAFHDKGNVAERGLSVNCNTFRQFSKKT